MSDVALCLLVGAKAARSLLGFSDDFRAIGNEISAAYFFFRDVEQMRAITADFIDTVGDLPSEIQEKCYSVGSTVHMFQYFRKRLKFALESVGGRPEGELSQMRQIKLHFKWTLKQKMMDRIQAEMQATRVAATCHIMILNTKELGFAISMLQARGEPVPIETRNKYKQSYLKVLDSSREAEELFGNLATGEDSTGEGVSTRAVRKFHAALKTTQTEADAVRKEYDQVQKQLSFAPPATKQQFKTRSQQHPSSEPPQKAAAGQPSTRLRHPIPHFSLHLATPASPQNNDHEEGSIGFFGARVRDNGRTVTTEEGLWPRHISEQSGRGRRSTTSSGGGQGSASGISSTTQNRGSSDRSGTSRAGSSSSTSRGRSGRRKK